MYIKKPILFGIVIFLLSLFVIGEYFYLENKLSPIHVKISNNEKKMPVSEESIIVKIELTPTPIVEDIKGVSIEVTPTPTPTPTPTVTPSLTIQQVQSYLNNLYSVKASWQNVKDNINIEDFNFLMDSFDRQISFCQTIIGHLINNPNPSEDDLKLWDGIQKMWGETGQLTIKLNENLAK